jgi:drug/metabolite transporter (DMT)-like permease
MSLVNSRWVLGLSFFAVYVVWGSSYMAVQLAATALPPLLLCGLRGLLGAGAIWLLLKHRGSQLPDLSDLRVWRGPALVGTLNITLSSVLLVWGLQHVSSGMTAVLFSTMPIFTCVINGVIQRHVAPRALVGTAMGIGGLLLVYAAHLGGSWGWGHACVLGAALLSAVASVLTERGNMPRSVLASSCMQMAVGGVVATTLSILTLEQVGSFSWSAAAALAYLAIAVTAGGFLGFNILTIRMGSTVATTYASINPIVALVLGGLVLGEQLSLWEGAGVVVVVLGVLLVQTTRKA